MIHLKVLRFDLKSTETHMKTLLLFSCLISFMPTVDVGQSAVTSIDYVVNGSMFWSKRQKLCQVLVHIIANPKAFIVISLVCLIV